MNNNTVNRLKVALTGSSGLIGSRVVELLKSDFDFISLSQEEMDITDREQVRKKLGNVDFDLFLHLAAYTNVDKAEEEKELCYKINVEGTKNVFEETLKKGKKFIYISTDFVFSGEKPPYDEDSQPDAHLGAYGLSKLEGEKVIGNKAMIVRLSFPYRADYERRPDFVRSLKGLLGQKKSLTMVADSVITPTFIDDIASGLKYLLNNYSAEVFHLVGKQSLSPFDACMLIAETFGLDKSLIGKTTFEEFYKGKAPRPQKSVITSKKNNFQPMKSFEEGLKEIKKQLS